MVEPRDLRDLSRELDRRLEETQHVVNARWSALEEQLRERERVRAAALQAVELAQRRVRRQLLMVLLAVVALAVAIGIAEPSAWIRVAAGAIVALTLVAARHAFVMGRKSVWTLRNAGTVDALVSALHAVGGTTPVDSLPQALSESGDLKRWLNDAEKQGLVSVREDKVALTKRGQSLAEQLSSQRDRDDA